MSKFINIKLEKMVLGNLCALSDPNDPILMDAMDRLHTTCFTGHDRQMLFEIMVKNHINGKEIADYAIAMDIYENSHELMDVLLDIIPDKKEPNSLLKWICDLNALRIDRGHLNLMDDLRTSFDLEIDRDAREALISTFTDKVVTLRDNAGSNSSYMRSSSECIDDLINELKNGNIRVKTGLRDLDSFLQGGLDSGSLVVIGGAPSSGKTHMALKMLLECHKLQLGKEALVFSLEGKASNVTQRLISHHQGVLFKKIDFSQQLLMMEDYREINISISDKQNLTVDQIYSTCKRAYLRNKISVVLVDYLDRVKKPNGDMRQDEKLAEISNQLANMAIEFNCIVILTTQLNKEAIKRPDHRPTPVDSKNSSGQSEAASYWFGIKRISQWDNGTRYPDSNLVELIVGKNRNDELEGIVYFETENSLYLDIDQNRALQLVLQSDLNRKAEIKRFDNLFNKGKKQ